MTFSLDNNRGDGIEDAPSAKGWGGSGSALRVNTEVTRSQIIYPNLAQSVMPLRARFGYLSPREGFAFECFPRDESRTDHCHFSCAFMLTKRPAPMMMWSTSSISRRRPASTNWLVVSISSGDGVGSPLGWLWQTMMPGQLLVMAGRKISATRSTELFTVPW